MTATDVQVRILMRERKKGQTQEQAAAKANLRSRKTVSKYEGLGQLPSQLKPPRSYRTVPDAFAEDWPEIERMLSDAPELEAKALFTWLQEQKPDKYQEKQMRTFQRRVSRWRGINQSQVATLEQIRNPGETMQLDGTWMNKLEVTIGGESFNHLLIHCVLPYSNWEWGRIAQSESLGAVRLGLQSSLLKLGYVPRAVQTDNSSAATRPLGISEQNEETGKRGYTAGYLHLLEHYGLEPQSTHVNSPNENGDVESSNGTFKRAVKQALLLRGSREFDDIESYEAFLQGIMEKRNRQRQERLAEEMEKMKPLKVTPLATRTRLKVRVSSGSLIRVLKKSYSVPTSLIGKEVTVYVYEWSLDVYYAGQLLDTLPRLIGQKNHHVNYRHIIDTLLRKPGGFRRYRYREEMFPQLIFRRAWEQLTQWYSPRRADLTYLQVLRLAARNLESDVALALELLVDNGEKWNEEDVTRLFAPDQVSVPELNCGQVELALYDQLLDATWSRQEVTYA